MLRPQASELPWRFPIMSLNVSNPENSYRCCRIFSHHLYPSTSYILQIDSCPLSCEPSWILSCRAFEHASATGQVVAILSDDKLTVVRYRAWRLWKAHQVELARRKNATLDHGFSCRKASPQFKAHSPLEQ